MGQDQASGKADDGMRKLILKLREKVPVETTQGTLYVRHMTLSDLNTFMPLMPEDGKVADFLSLGTLAIKTFTGGSADGGDKSPISDGIFEAFTDEDFPLLANAVAKACDLGECGFRRNVTADSEIVRPVVPRS